MDSFSQQINSSSSSSSSVPRSVIKYHLNEGKRVKSSSSSSLNSFRSSLHTIRRVPKPMTKKPIAPMPPTPPKIYKVEPLHFKETVQMLTTAPEFAPPPAEPPPARRLQDVAPPPLNLKPMSSTESVVSSDADVTCAREEIVMHDDNSSIDNSNSNNPRTPSNVCGGFSSPLFPPLSPASLSWWASILPSPGTLSSM